MEHRNKYDRDSGPIKDERDFFNRIAKSWDRESDTNQSTKIRYILSVLGLKGNERILDVGTGTGVMIPFYEEKLTAGSVHAIDFAEMMIGECIRKYPSSEHPGITFEVADVYDLTYKEEFDVVMSYSCFPHFTEHQKAIDIFAKALKKGGRFAIAHSSSREFINNIHGKSNSREIEDDVLPDLDELRPMFANAGLRTVFERSDDEYHVIVGEKL